jgi:uncharacterized membrane protein YdjX (TVP38/TMEM64 family)
LNTSGSVYLQKRNVVNQKKLQKLLVVAAIGVIVFTAYKLGLHEKLSLDYLKSSQSQLATEYANNPALVLGIFAAVYILATALSLPGAAVLTLGAGGLFGFWVGTILVSFASTIGATLACLGSRFLFRDWVQSKFGAQIQPINKGIAEEGAFYLFTLRLIPIFPFFMINLIIGVTPMRISTFFWVSQIGMLAGTMVYVNAGKELSKIDSLGGILSPNLILSFVILGLFPIAMKKIVTKIQARRATT